jgi:hypothetical protein
MLRLALAEASRPQTKECRGVSYLFALFPIGIGLVLWWLGVKSVVATRKQSGWATTQGLIRTSSVKTSDVKVPLLGATKVHSTGWSGTGAPKVTYEYVVAGRNYTGTKVGMPPQRGRWGGRNSNRRIDWNLALYEEGASIPVHYDPANPSDAILHKAEGSGCALVMLFAVGSIFIGIGLLAWTVIRSLP